MLAGAQSKPLLEANILASVAGFQAMLGEFDDARASAQHAERIYVDLGLRLAFAGLTQICGPVELLAGDAVAAENIIRRGYDILHEIGATGESDALLAEALYQQGRYDETLLLTEDALARTPELDVAPRVLLLGVVAKLAARGDDDGEAPAREAVELAEKTDALNLQAEAYANLAEALLLLDREEDAAAAAGAALRLYERKGNRAAVARLQTMKV
jgi:tetratricopeptide (TPR) repeat protein